MMKHRKRLLGIVIAAAMLVTAVQSPVLQADAAALPTAADDELASTEENVYIEDYMNEPEEARAALFDTVVERAEDEADLLQLRKFSSELDTINEEYDDGQEYISVTPEEYDLSAAYAFQTCRLLVKSEREIEDPDACAAAGPFQSMYVLQYEDEDHAREAYRFYEAQEYVEFVQPDQVYTILADAETDFGNDPEQKELTQENPTVDSLISVQAETAKNSNWGVAACSFSDMEKRLEKQYGNASFVPQITVAVIDTGIDYSHELFAGRISDRGFNVIDHNNLPQDDYWHGTSVSGIVALSTPDYVQILPVKVSDYDIRGNIQLTNANLYAGVEYAILAGADVVNMSFGGYSLEPVTQAYLEDCSNAGVVVVSSYGNDKRCTQSIYPACYGDVIGVSAVKQDLSFASTYSNYGAGVDLAAPGSDIYTACPMDLSVNGYASVTGTSFAAPYVSAAVALTMAYMPGASVKELEAFLFANARDLGAAGWDQYYGYGMLSFDQMWDSNSVSGSEKEYTVSFFTDGAASVATQKLAVGQVVTKPKALTKPGYHFTGWYLDSFHAISYDFSRKVENNLVLFAGWEKHRYTVKTTAATYTKTGKKTYTCACGDTYSEKLARLSLKKPVVSSVTNTSSGIKLKWKKVTGAAGYYVYRRLSGGKWKKIATLTKKSSVTYTDKTAKNAKIYFYRIRAYNSKQQSSYSASSRTVRLATTSITKKKKAKNRITIQYKAVSGATGYQVSYSTTKSFSKNVKKKLVKSGKTLQKKITGLKSRKTYYIRVRAYRTVSGKKYYGAWSKVKKVTTSS